ncbi:MAG: hypothetical protein E7130_05810 [Rikenellaceae bacterium]|nr:hypothetical protein [Rikenellaceae bacterium]MBQ7342945.1 hypothetical protein [Alistipes sp.]
MKKLSQSSSHHKPVGGVRAVALSATDNIAEVQFAAGGVLCTSLKFVDDDAVMECSLLEEGSCYEEEILPDGLAVAVKHRLILTSDRNLAEAWLEPDFRLEGLYRGLCAIVTLNDGRKLLVGYSERFEAQQPLRIVSIKNSSEQRCSDVPTVVLVLENYDTSEAPIIVTD